VYLEYSINRNFKTSTDNSTNSLQKYEKLIEINMVPASHPYDPALDSEVKKKNPTSIAASEKIVSVVMRMAVTWRSGKCKVIFVRK
jgi:hypothetical protein